MARLYPQNSLLVIRFNFKSDLFLITAALNISNEIRLELTSINLKVSQKVIY